MDLSTQSRNVLRDELARRITRNSNRNIHASIRFSPGEMARIKELCHEYDIKVSSFIWIAAMMAVEVLE